MIWKHVSVEVAENGANDTSQCCAQCVIKRTHFAALQRSSGDSQIKRPPGWLKRWLFIFFFSLLFFSKEFKWADMWSRSRHPVKMNSMTCCSNNCNRLRYVRQHMGEKFSVSVRKSLFDKQHFFFFYNYIINSVLTSCHSSGGGCCQVSLLSACYSVYMFTLRQRWCGAKKRTGTQEASVHCR